MNLAGRKLTTEVGRVAVRADGAAFMYCGDTVVLTTVIAFSKPRERTDFFPLNVECEEKLYPVGKIPGGFNKREGKAPENAVPTYRIISHPTHPLFPEDYRNDVMLDDIVMSVDPDCSPELTAILGSAIATSISDIPFVGPYAITQVGPVNGEFVINSTAGQKQISDMALTAASTREKMIMTEVDANKVPGQQMIGAIFKAHEMNQEIIRLIDTIVAECDKEKHTYESYAVPEEPFTAIREIAPPSEMEEAVFTDNKQAREGNIAAATEHLEGVFADNEKWLSVLRGAIYQYQKKTVRKMILKDHKHPDGRAIDQIRHLAVEVDLLSRVHGSSMFTCGQTQILSACTLAPLFDIQRIDSLDENETNKRHIHRYNFLSFSVSETEPSRGPGHREIGHGALAGRTLISVLPNVEEFLYTIRTVSGAMKSNGSTSQVSIYASTLSLMAAGVPIKEMVTGTSYGLVTGDTDGDYIVFTDIQGLEDFFGDMDFRVGNTKNSITAIQMNVRIHGLTRPVIEEAIIGTREARMHILKGVMKPIISGPRKHLNPYAPKIKQISINPQKIGDVVGKQGKMISKIIEETGVKIDIIDDSSVSVCGMDETMIDKAITIITEVVTDIETGMVLNGKVARIMNFGAFVELALNKDGMVHISKLSDKGVGKVEDVVNIGDEVTIRATEVSKMGRINLIMRPSDLAGKKEEAVTEK